MTTFYEYDDKGLERLDKDIINQTSSSTLQSILALNYNIVLKLSFFEYRICRVTSFLAKKDYHKETLGKCIRHLEKMEDIKSCEKSKITIKSIQLIADARNCYIHNFIYHGLVETSNIGAEEYSTRKVDIKKLMERMGNYQDFLATLEVFNKFDILYMLTGKKYPGENQREESKPKYEAGYFKNEMEKIYGDDKRLSNLMSELKGALKSSI